MLANVLKLALFLGLGVFLVWWAVSGFGEEERRKMLDSLVGVEYGWLLLSMGLSFLSNLSRAMRWQLMLEPVAKRPGLLNSYFSVMVGYFVNLAIPRLGEVSRCTAISKYGQVPFTTAFGTVVTERIIDLLMLVLLVALMLLTQFGVIYEPAMEKLILPFAGKLNALISVKGLLVLLLLLAAVGFWLYRRKAGKGGKREPSGLSNRIRHFLGNMEEGVQSVRKVKNQPLFWAHTFFIWTCYVLMIFVCTYSMEVTKNVGFGGGLSAMVFGAFGIIVTPGGLGSYPILVGWALEPYGIVYNMGYAFGWVVWTAQTVSILVIGLLSLILLPVVNKKASPVPEVEGA